jgi:phospholipase A1
MTNNLYGRHTAAVFIVTAAFATTAMVAVTPVFADSAELDRDCVMELAETADDSMTLAEIRNQCVAAKEATDIPAAAVAETTSESAPSAVDQRLAAEHEAAASPFSILAHRPNYFLVAAYNWEGWDSEFDNKNIESQFQLSLKVPLAVGLFNDKMDIYGAYTNRSFWQMYNSGNSEPFRETNHEPEIWAQFRNDWEIWGLTNSLNTVGFAHQSNGRSGNLSRSWNRIYASFLFEKGNWTYDLKPWIWVSRDKETSDNPDIDDYMGYGEFRVSYGKNNHVVSGMFRNLLESGFDKGAAELSWSFPVFNYPYLKGYVQYFYGYGESLIDYNHKVNRLGIGISVTDWLH